jgi:hypothetical protein
MIKESKEEAPISEEMIDRGLKEERMSRASGRIVQLWDAKAEGNKLSVEEDEEGDPLRWITFCTAHGSLYPHSTRKGAREWLAAPDVWCGSCAEEMNAGLYAGRPAPGGPPEEGGEG